MDRKMRCDKVMVPPRLSVIIPVYNGEKYLSEAIESVLMQPCEDFEIIIVDDGSKDSSGVIADFYAEKDERIRVFRIPNGGVSVARNMGIVQAHGTYIAFLDADDVLCANAYSEDVHTALCLGAYDIFSFAYLKGIDDLSVGRLCWAEPGCFARGDKEYIRQLEKSFCSYLFRRSLFADQIRFPEGIRYHEDVVFLFLIGRSARNLLQFSKPWFIYRMNYASTMHNLKDAEYVLEEIEAWAWCKRNSVSDKDRKDCDGNIFSYMVEYIKLSCRYGVPAETICRRVCECGAFCEAMNNYGSFWINEDTANFYQDFMKNPRKHWFWLRIAGVIYMAVSRIVRTGIGKCVDRLIRYRLSLAEYLSKTVR